MANFSSKKLMMKNKPGGVPSSKGTLKGQYAQKNTSKTTKKKLADVSREDMMDAGFKSFGKQSLRQYLNMKNKLGRKPTKKDFETKKETKTSTVKIIRSDKGKGHLAKFLKKPKSVIDKRGKQIQRMAQQKMTAEDNIRRQIDAAKKPKKKQSVITSSYNRKPNTGAMSYRKKGGDLFVAKQYGGKII